MENYLGYNDAVGTGNNRGEPVFPTHHRHARLGFPLPTLNCDCADNTRIHVGASHVAAMAALENVGRPQFVTWDDNLAVLRHGHKTNLVLGCSECGFRVLIL
jgi:hypothetical protein